MYKRVKLISKRNHVCRIVDDGGGSCIEKVFACGDSMLRETEILKLLKEKGVAVPKILAERNNCLILTDIGERTFLDIYEEAEADMRDCGRIAIGLAEWLADFYGAARLPDNGQLILNDINFRNFVVIGYDDVCTIAGVDFENVSPGFIEADIGRLAAYGLTYDPPMTEWKVCFVKCVVDSLCHRLDVDRNVVRLEAQKGMEEIERRRNVKFDYGDLIQNI